MKSLIPKNRREFCCSDCGLIWFGEEGVRRAACPECHSSTGIYACDTFGYAYASEAIRAILIERGKKIHYAIDHPLFERNNKNGNDK